jgi:hypothetical protein
MVGFRGGSGASIFNYFGMEMSKGKSFLMCLGCFGFAFAADQTPNPVNASSCTKLMFAYKDGSRGKPPCEFGHE